MRFVNKLVTVTGGSSGIGAAIAVSFARKGAKVAIEGRNEKNLNLVLKKWGIEGKAAYIIKADLTNEEEAKTVVDKIICEFGKMDVLVNNAAVVVPGSLLDGTLLAAYDRALITNLRPLIQISSLAAPYLVKTKGNIVNISGVGSMRTLGLTNCTAFFISEAARDHFTRCAAYELASSGVRVNCVNPGPVHSNITKNSGYIAANEEINWDVYKNLTALGRISEPEEIADLVLFLASEKAKSINDSVFLVDNGVSIKN